MSDNRNTTIEWHGRRWGHQQAQSLLRELGTSGEVSITCIWGVWFATIIFRGPECFDGLGHGKTLWLAVVAAMGQNGQGRECAGNDKVPKE